MHTVLTIASGTCFLIGVFFLAYAVEFQADKQAKGDSRLQRALKEMGGPAKLNRVKHRTGLILSCLGYVLLLLSTAL
jgi:hypothetical protein